MGGERQTQSETLFEELCTQHGIAYTRIPVFPGCPPQPDYELVLAGGKVIAEVKQIDPNADDRRFTETLSCDHVATQRRNPDLMARRVRNAIRNSVTQIKSRLRSHPGVPAALVLFDAARNGYTDPYVVQTAMHGWEHVVFDVSLTGDAPRVMDRGFPRRNNRAVRRDKNQQLSALATLHECWNIDTRERFLELCFYHNHYAAHPILPEWWTGGGIRHATLSVKEPGKFQEWVDVTPKSRLAAVDGVDNPS